MEGYKRVHFLSKKFKTIYLWECLLVKPMWYNCLKICWLNSQFPKKIFHTQWYCLMGSLLRLIMAQSVVITLINQACWFESPGLLFKSIHSIPFLKLNFWEIKIS
jgi:hypothetical protein